MTKFVKVWRVENDQGAGVYCTGWAYRALGENQDDERSHLPPSRDPGLENIWPNLENQDDWHFGFASLAQYKAWFFKAEIRRKLNADDYFELKQKLRLYLVPAEYVHKGKCQVIFVRSKAELIDSRPCNYCD